MAKRTTKYTRQAILNLCMVETSPGVFALALCNPDGSNIGLGAVDYKGTWDANTNSPDLPATTPVKGDYYVISVAGSTSLGGITDWKVGDWAIYNGTIWQKVDNTENAFAAAMDQGVAIADKPTFAGFISTSDSNVQADMRVSDNISIYFGAGNDGKIYSDGGSLYIETPSGIEVYINDVNFDWYFGGNKDGLELRTLNNYMQFNTSGILFNEQNNDVDFVIEKNTSGEAFKYDAGNDKFIINSQVSIDQTSSTAAIPVVVLDQGDESEPFVDFIGATEAGATKSLSSWVDANIDGFIQVDINGSKKWIAYYNDPTES